jgi:hypothetical protein
MARARSGFVTRTRPVAADARDDQLHGARREGAIEGLELGDVADPLRGVAGVVPEDRRVAPLRGDQAERHLHQRRLAGAVGADDGEEVPGSRSKPTRSRTSASPKRTLTSWTCSAGARRWPRAGGRRSGRATAGAAPAVAGPWRVTAGSRAGRRRSSAAAPGSSRVPGGRRAGRDRERHAGLRRDHLGGPALELRLAEDHARAAVADQAQRHAQVGGAGLASGEGFDLDDQVEAVACGEVGPGVVEGHERGARQRREAGGELLVQGLEVGHQRGGAGEVAVGARGVDVGQRSREVGDGGGHDQRVEPHVALKPSDGAAGVGGTRSGKLSASTRAHASSRSARHARRRAPLASTRLRSHRSSPPFMTTRSAATIRATSRGVGSKVCGEAPGARTRTTSASSPAIWRTRSKSGWIDTTTFGRAAAPRAGRGRGTRPGAGGGLFENGFSSRRSYTRGPPARKAHRNEGPARRAARDTRPRSR